MAEQLIQSRSVIDAFFDTQHVPQTTLDILRKSITIKKIKKGEIIQKKGDTTLRNHFVLKGCLRSYTVDEKNKEHIFMFAPEGWVIADIESQTNNAPAVLFIDAIEDSEVELFERDFIDKAVKIIQAPGFTTTRLLRRVSVLQKRIIMLMSATALERYEHFLETYPDIVQRVPQKMVASYLGITPEALSKIRGRMMGKK